MAKYKVVKGNVGGFGGKVFAKDSICSSSDFPAGNAEDLEKMGYLELIAETDSDTDENSDVDTDDNSGTDSETDSDDETETETDETETDETETDETTETDSDTDEKPLSIRSMNKPDIIQILVMKDIEFKENASKEELYDLYVRNF